MSNPLTQFLQNQSIEETIEVLDEVLCLLVLHTDCVGLSDKLAHQYVTIRDLRNVFVRFTEQGQGKV